MPEFAMADETPSSKKQFEVHGFDLEYLISIEEDSRQRVYLIVLNNVHKSLLANTQAVQAVSDRFEAHKQVYEKDTKDRDDLMSRGKGAWKVAAWALGLAQIAVVASGTWVVNEIATLHATDVRVEQQLARLIGERK